MANRVPGSTHAIVLAAGSSERIGRPKQLLELGGETMLNRCLRQVSGVSFAGITLTLGAGAEQIIPTLPAQKTFEVFLNPDYEKGLGNSIASSVKYILKSVRPESVVLILADQPFLTSEHLRTLLNAHEPGSEEMLLSDYGNGSCGPPVLITQQFFKELCQLDGDKGAKSVISQHPEVCRKIDLIGFLPIDIDTPENYQSFLEQLRKRV